MMGKIKEFLHSKLFKQLFRFGIVGGLAFLIDSGVLFVLTEYLNVYYLVSSVISFIVSLIFNYILSIFWVFDVKKKQTINEISLFVILSVIGLGINQLIYWLCVEFLAIHYLVSKIGATAVVMVYNFITRKLFLEK